MSFEVLLCVSFASFVCGAMAGHAFLPPRAK
jgi:hypothetical protein